MKKLLFFMLIVLLTGCQAAVSPAPAAANRTVVHGFHARL